MPLTERSAEAKITIYHGEEHRGVGFCPDLAAIWLFDEWLRSSSYPRSTESPKNYNASAAKLPYFLQAGGDLEVIPRER